VIDRRDSGHGRVTAVLISLFFVAFVVGCGTSADGSQTPGPTQVVPSDVPCQIEQPPGPDDAPPQGGGEIDTTNLGGGRWRLCLTQPTTVSVEGTAWCRWDAAHAKVDEVSGLPASAGTVDYDAFMSFLHSGFEVHLTDRAHGGVIANYGPRFDLPETTTGADHREGTAPFEVVLLADEGEAPAGAPAALTGQLIWACGDAPAA
jgi:hypothetical protein